MVGGEDNLNKASKIKLLIAFRKWKGEYTEGACVFNVQGYKKEYCQNVYAIGLLLLFHS